MSRLLITGSSGLLGSNLAKIAAPLFDVYAAYNTNKVHIKDVSNFSIDLSSPDAVLRLNEISPEVIIHCAANTSLDECELNPEKAYNQNVLTSINVARSARTTGAYLIFISTDSVFDGKKGDYREEDTPNPVNVYSKTKLEAENQVFSIHPGSCIARVNIYGWNKREKFSLAEWMLDKLENNQELTGFKDVFYTPILVNDLAEYLFRIIDLRYEGILHIGQRESCSKLDFAYMVADVFNLDANLIKPISIDDLNLEAPRPKNCSLNTAKAEDALGIPMPGVRQGLETMKRLRQEGYVRELKND